MTIDRIDRVRRALTASLLGACTVPWQALRAQRPSITVWTGPGCGCCREWIKHLQAHGFDVAIHDGGNAGARARLGMPVRYGSCHTAEIAGFAIEGHVPAGDINRLLAERPDAVGLAVPAMPRGSPGMEMPDGGRDPYDVLLIARDGSASVFESYR
jgi:hypothetical protein